MQRVLESLDITSFDAPISKEMQMQAVTALEQGKAVYLPQLQFTLKNQEEQFLSPLIVSGKAKNVSYDRKKDLLSGTANVPDIDQLKEMMKRYADSSRSFIEKLFPGYVTHLDQARTSFRPVEIAGRVSSYRKDDKRLHVDAFPSTPVQGKRILRFFSNINPNGQDRVWRLGEPFHQVVQKFGKDIKEPLPGLAWFLKTFKITKQYRTLYDHYMLNLHDTMKGDEDYQKAVEQYEILFPAGSSWIVFTDQASHAAMSGQHVLEQTFYLPPEGQDNPETSPLRVLERFYGKKLI